MYLKRCGLPERTLQNGRFVHTAAQVCTAKPADVGVQPAPPRAYGPEALASQAREQLLRLEPARRIRLRARREPNPLHFHESAPPPPHPTPQSRSEEPNWRPVRRLRPPGPPGRLAPDAGPRPLDPCCVRSLRAASTLQPDVERQVGKGPKESEPSSRPPPRSYRQVVVPGRRGLARLPVSVFSDPGLARGVRAGPDRTRVAGQRAKRRGGPCGPWVSAACAWCCPRCMPAACLHSPTLDRSQHTSTWRRRK